MKTLRMLVEREPNVRRGLLALEVVVLAYVAFTTVLVIYNYQLLPHGSELLWGRLKMVLMLLGLWLVYRLVPCKLTMALRVFTQLAVLAWWYPDTYELNRVLPNLDHLFAGYEQQLFGCQPSLMLSEWWPSPVVSELVDIGYVSYYPMMVSVLLAYFFTRYHEFTRCAFLVLGSFFIYYVVFDLFPVVGPTYYFQAIGVENAVNGVFPVLGDYFNTHSECMTTPGYTSGFGYWLVEIAKVAGERPTAAFPSSHVGVATVCMFMAARLRTPRLFLVLLPFYILLCIATVYIQAHYAIDAIAGLVSGLLISVVLLSSRWEKPDNVQP